MASKVEIIVDNYVRGGYRPGQTISGRVECFFHVKKNVRAVRLKFKGRAKTKWSRRSGKSSTTYTGEEIYFCDDFNLISGGDDFYLEAGTHSYPFYYILPHTLPSSYEGKYGKIKYTVKATVDRPWKVDYEQKLVFDVFSPLDLNSVPGLKNPYAASLDKEVSRGCCSFGSDPLTFNISLPARGYAVGQNINIGAFIENLSNVTVMCVEFKITQVIVFSAYNYFTSKDTKIRESFVTSSISDAIGAHGEKSWTQILPIPAFNFPNLMPCGIISATYRLEIEAVLPGPHSNLSTSFPIMIGNIPLSGINMELPGTPPPLQTTSFSSNPNATDPLAAVVSADGSSTSAFEDFTRLPETDTIALNASAAVP